METKESILNFLASNEPCKIIEMNDKDRLCLTKMTIENFDFVYGYTIYNEKMRLVDKAELKCIYHRPTNKMYEISYNLKKTLGMKFEDYRSFDMDSIKMNLASEVTAEIIKMVQNNTANLSQDKLEPEESLEKRYNDYGADRIPITLFLQGKNTEDVAFTLPESNTLSEIRDNDLFMYIDKKPIVEKIAKRYIDKCSAGIQFVLYQNELTRQKLNEIIINPDPLLVKVKEINEAVSDKQTVLVTFQNKKTGETVTEKIKTDAFLFSMNRYWEISEYEMTENSRKNIRKVLYEGARSHDILIEDIVKIEFSRKQIWPLK